MCVVSRVPLLNSFVAISSFYFFASRPKAQWWTFFWRAFWPSWSCRPSLQPQLPSLPNPPWIQCPPSTVPWIQRPPLLPSMARGQRTRVTSSEQSAQNIDTALTSRTAISRWTKKLANVQWPGGLSWSLWFCRLSSWLLQPVSSSPSPSSSSPLDSASTVSASGSQTNGTNHEILTPTTSNKHFLNSEHFKEIFSKELPVSDCCWLIKLLFCLKHCVV